MEDHSDHLTIIKLGGSVITRDDGDFDSANVLSLAQEIVSCDRPVIIIHGGGVFSRRVIARHSLQSDFLSSADVAVIEELRAAIRQLRHLVIQQLESVGLRCSPVEPHTCMISAGGEIITSTLDSIREVMCSDATPVLHGDVIIDRSHDFFTISSDQVASYVARQMRPRDMLFVTDVDGVYEEFPPQSSYVGPVAVADSGLLRRLPDNYIVGGEDMRGKLKQALACAPSVGTCSILNGRVRGNVFRRLRDDFHIGTRVVGDSHPE